MLWFIVAAIGYLLLAIVGILDKIILTKKVGNPSVYAFYSTIIMLPLFVLLPLGVQNLVGIDWFWGIASGVFFGLGLWTMFVAVKKGESSHINPFIGAVIIIVTYFLSAFFLGEKLSGSQLLGVLLLVSATVLFSAERSRHHSGFHSGFAWAILAGIIFALSHTTAKYIYGLYPFLSALVWTKASIGLVGLFLLVIPAVRASFQSKKKSPSKTEKKKHSLILIVVNKVFSIGGVLFIQYAIAIGSVTLVNAMSGLQFAFLFGLAYSSTKLMPTFFKEYFTKREIISESVAVVMMLMGSVLIVW